MKFDDKNLDPLGASLCRNLIRIGAEPYEKTRKPYTGMVDNKCMGHESETI